MHSSTIHDATSPVTSTSERVSIRDFLRAETGALHSSLHKAAPFRALLEGALSHEQYAMLLRCMAAFHDSMTLLVRAGSEALGLPQLIELHQRRLERLRADMAALCLPSGAAPALAIARGEAFAIGCAYTVQGSSLGAPVLDRALRRMFPSAPGRSFFQGETEESSVWRDFCAALERRSYTPDDLHALGADADYAFRVFQRGLERCR